MIGLSSILADSSGAITFETMAATVLKDTTRRVSRTKTLDGGCVIVDGGFSDGDRTFSIVTKYDETVADTIDYLHQNKTLIYVVADENIYSGAIASLSIKTDIKLQILVKEKLND